VAEAQAEARVREELLEAGVKRSELDYAVQRFASRVSTMSERDLKTYEVGSFVAEIGKDVPYLFVEGRAPKPEQTAEEKTAADAAAKAAADKAAADAAAAAKTGATTGAATGGAAKEEKAGGFNALTAKPSEVAARLAEIHRMANTPRQAST
jgi:membrane protein involved in colicin uptake